MSGPVEPSAGRAVNANHVPSGENAAASPTTDTPLTMARAAAVGDAVIVGSTLGSTVGSTLGSADVVGSVDGEASGGVVGEVAGSGVGMAVGSGVTVGVGL